MSNKRKHKKTTHVEYKVGADEYRVTNSDGTDWVYLTADELRSLWAQLSAMGFGEKP